MIVFDEDEHLCALEFEDHGPRLQRLLKRHYGASGETCALVNAGLPGEVETALGNYFAGELTAIDTVPVRTNGTPFQKQVWAALRKIPPGTTSTYGALAHCIGKPRAIRAVGAANGANPVGIVVPCHRVIGADGSLTGYGGGVERKAWLLRHEGAR